jgi:predicted nucleotidyltransferase
VLSDGDIARIGQRIVRSYGPLVVAVFGSYALGTSRERSDLDVLIVKRTPEPRPARRYRVLRHLVGVLHRLDVHVFTPEELEEEAREELSFAWVIVRQARILHPTLEEAQQLVPAFAAGVRVSRATPPASR